MHEGPAAETDMLVDCARRVLKAQYRKRLKELEFRLGSFESVNWEGIKLRLRNHPGLMALPEGVRDPEEVVELRLQAILGWIEDILSA